MKGYILNAQVLTPAPSRIMSLAQKQVAVFAEGEKDVKGLSPLTAKTPSYLTEIAYFRFEIKMGGVRGKY